MPDFTAFWPLLIWLATCLGMWVILFQSPLMIDLVRTCRPVECKMTFTHTDLEMWLLGRAGSCRKFSCEWIMWSYLHGVWMCPICQGVLVTFVTTLGFHAYRCPIAFWWWPVTFLATLPLTRWLQQKI